MAKISVLIPVYNVEKYLNRCVDSILNQTYKDFELVLVDDGSTDNSSKICDEYKDKDSRVHVIHKENGGVSTARNVGLDYAFSTKSEWIAYIDSDDWVVSDYLESLLNLTKKYNVKCAICGVKYTDGVDIDTNGSEVGLISVDEFYSLRNNKADNTCAVSVHDKLYSIELFNDLRFPVGQIHEDRALSYKILTKCDNVAVTNKQLYYYYCAPNSIARSSWSPKRMSAVYFLDEQYEFFKDNTQYKNAFKSTVLDFFVDLSMYILEIRKFKLKQYKKYYKIMYKKLKEKFILYKSLCKENEEIYNMVYYALFPVRMKILLYLRAIKRRIKH